jgi:chemotaxis response regulator CheB
MKARFLQLIRRSSPDVIVLDFSRPPDTGAETILALRRKIRIPILVVCDPENPKTEEYRMAGAADCIAPPAGIIGLSEAVQRIMQTKRRGRLTPRRTQQRASAGAQPQFA